MPVAKAFSIVAARVLALSMATSAGILAYAHFLTADLPVMLWMLLAFYFAQRVMFENNVSVYLLAGFFTGIAAIQKGVGNLFSRSILSCTMIQDAGKGS